MPSPFPGMDPYIDGQNRWPDFHHEMISQCRAVLNASLPDDYVATINERVQTIELAEQQSRVALPDVSVVRDPVRNPVSTGPRAPDELDETAVATLEPHTLPQSVEWLDEPTEGYIEIFHLPEYRLVTGIEVLSPSNKINPGRVAYLSKHRDLLQQGANLVEIDLLLAGERGAARPAAGGGLLHLRHALGESRPLRRVRLVRPWVAADDSSPVEAA